MSVSDYFFKPQAQNHSGTNKDRKIIYIFFPRTNHAFDSLNDTDIYLENCPLLPCIYCWCLIFPHLSIKQELRFKQESGGSGCCSYVYTSFWSSIRETVDCPSQFSTLIKRSQMKTIKVESSIIKQIVIHSSLCICVLATSSKISRTAPC